MQKTTVGTVDIKTSLGGGKKRKERASRDSQTKEMGELRIGKDHGAKSGSRTAQAPPWVMGQGLSMMQVQERSSSLAGPVAAVLGERL